MNRKDIISVALIHAVQVFILYKALEYLVGYFLFGYLDLRSFIAWTFYSELVMGAVIDIFVIFSVVLVSSRLLRVYKKHSFSLNKRGILLYSLPFFLVLYYVAPIFIWGYSFHISLYNLILLAISAVIYYVSSIMFLPYVKLSHPNKKLLYSWVVVILGSIGVDLVIIIHWIHERIRFYPGKPFPSDVFYDSYYTFPFLLSFLFLFIFLFIPVWLSSLKSKWGKKIGYGFPALLLIATPFLVIWAVQTCSGLICGTQMNLIMAAWLIGFSFCFYFVYWLSLKFQKWNKKVVLFIIGVESFILLGMFLYVLNLLTKI